MLLFYLAILVLFQFSETASDNDLYLLFENRADEERELTSVSVPERVKYKLSVMVHSCLKGQAPQ